MTDNAPERIWAYTGSVQCGVASWEWGLAYQDPDIDDDWPAPVQFTRTDVAAADQRRAVEAMREACLEAADHIAHMDDCSYCNDADLIVEAIRALPIEGEKT